MQLIRFVHFIKNLPHFDKKAGLLTRSMIKAVGIGNKTISGGAHEKLGRWCVTFRQALAVTSLLRVTRDERRMRVKPRAEVTEESGECDVIGGLYSSDMATERQPCKSARTGEVSRVTRNPLTTSRSR